MNDLIVDTERGRDGSKFHHLTGIFVRARYGGAWSAYDIATLTLASLKEWLRSRGGTNLWAESVVASLLEWTPEEVHAAWPVGS